MAYGFSLMIWMYASLNDKLSPWTRPLNREFRASRIEVRFVELKPVKIQKICLTKAFYEYFFYDPFLHLLEFIFPNRDMVFSPKINFFFLDCWDNTDLIQPSLIAIPKWVEENIWNGIGFSSFHSKNIRNLHIVAFFSGHVEGTSGSGAWEEPGIGWLANMSCWLIVFFSLVLLLAPTIYSYSLFKKWNSKHTWFLLFFFSTKSQ